MSGTGDGTAKGRGYGKKEGLPAGSFSARYGPQLQPQTMTPVLLEPWGLILSSKNVQGDIKPWIRGKSPSLLPVSEYLDLPGDILPLCLQMTTPVSPTSPVTSSAQPRVERGS